MRLVLIVLPLLAGSPALANDDSNKRVNKGAETICRAVAETGSRLARKRICLTREQWSEHRRVMKEELEAAQKIRTGPDGQ